MTTALVIEDNEDNMVLITRLLRSAGYQTIEASTGQQGYELAREVKPDFVILDIQLSDISGEEVIKNIRSDDQIRDLPVIAMTSFAMAGDQERMLALGFTGYLEKPIDPMRVLAQIKELLGL